MLTFALGVFAACLLFWWHGRELYELGRKFGRLEARWEEVQRTEQRIRETQEQAVLACEQHVAMTAPKSQARHLRVVR